MQLSLCMIVRDSVRTLPAALQSIRPWVDEMVVVDTGSQDNTPDIAEQFGARVFHFPWCDDFAAARNESLRHAQGNWIFWMDSDDTIDQSSGCKLRELASREVDPSLMGYIMQVHCPGPGAEAETEITVVDHVKLFRNLPELRFQGRVHEQILMSIRRAGGTVAWTDLFVVHSGSDQTPAGRARKRQRDLRLLHRELDERPEHPFTLFNLGMTYCDAMQYDAAADYLRRSIQRSGPEESHLRKAYALLAQACARLGRGDEAWQTCQRGFELFPNDAELQFRAAMLLHSAGRLEEAALAYQRLLESHEERHLASVDRGLSGFRAHQNLAAVYMDMGDVARAEHQWRRVIHEMPRYRSGWRGLGEVLLHQGRHQEALAVVGHLLGEKSLFGEALLLRAEVAMARGDAQVARGVLEQAVNQYPEDLEPLRRLCRLLFEHADPGAARQAIAELTRRDPQDAAAYHNLGTLHFRLGEPAQAVDAYRESLRLRPDAPHTHLHLGYALRELGLIDEAVSAWQEVLRLAPGDAAATCAIQQIRAVSARDHE